MSFPEKIKNQRRQCNLGDRYKNVSYTNSLTLLISLPVKLKKLCYTVFLSIGRELYIVFIYETLLLNKFKIHAK
jgi:hypothetical protein